jgi:hypothetical protein
MGQIDILYILSYVSSFSTPGKFHAYLDPGSGSYFIQLLLASLMGGLFALGVFRKKVIAFFQNLFSSRNDEQDKDS